MQCLDREMCVGFFRLLQRKETLMCGDWLVGIERYALKYSSAKLRLKSIYTDAFLVTKSLQIQSRQRGSKRCPRVCSTYMTFHDSVMPRTLSWGLNAYEQWRRRSVGSEVNPPICGDVIEYHRPYPTRMVGFQLHRPYRVSCTNTLEYYSCTPQSNSPHSKDYPRNFTNLVYSLRNMA